MATVLRLPDVDRTTLILLGVDSQLRGVLSLSREPGNSHLVAAFDNATTPSTWAPHVRPLCVGRTASTPASAWAASNEAPYGVRQGHSHSRVTASNNLIDPGTGWYLTLLEPLGVVLCQPPPAS